MVAGDAGQTIKEGETDIWRAVFCFVATNTRLNARTTRTQQGVSQKR
jgi:hypothetical protein